MFWFGSHEPHRKYEYNSGNKFGNKNLTDIESIPPFWIDNDITRTDLLDYAYEVEYFDKQLEKILSVLEKYNQMENTIVIVTSDNECLSACRDICMNMITIYPWLCGRSYC